MHKLEFGIVHRGCLVNEMSRALPDIRLICPGGFILGPNTVEEVIAIDRPEQDDIDRVFELLEAKAGIAEAELLERTTDKAFIRILVSISPDTGFCSQAVARNRGFRIGMELQEGGVEKWTVGCIRRADAEKLVEELRTMGELTYQTIEEVSWQALCG